MTEENKELENSEAVRKPVTPDSLQSEGDSGDRSPTKGDRSPGRTEHDISSEPLKDTESSNSDQTGTVRKLVVSTADGDPASPDDDRSPGRTEK